MAGEQASYFLGPANGSAVTALSAYTYSLLAPLASAMNDTAAASLYTSTALNLRTARNTELWNPELGVYSLSLTDKTNYSLPAIAWTIISGTANTSQTASMLATALPNLRLGVGYRTSSADPSLNTTNLSPNIHGFLLEALFHAHRNTNLTQGLPAAKNLLEDFWSQMVTRDEYFSGASWEYLYPDGSPGLGPFTSLAHPWGAAPTYILHEYVLGISATAAGFRRWEFRPLVQGLGLGGGEWNGGDAFWGYCG
ncbi:hypothetical protein LTR62_004414 [Meristemomyces frigidus]|uniref:Uncharacterized protein n=1 Tax=Meristemomyces frigidus TaxID=1508187 RepID=A0AAN7THR3_9PEZI|nr:hypothetical protein LTR62_004414 [Meristemomyces frigidus]